MCKPSHVEQTEGGGWGGGGVLGMSRNALSCGGGGAQTVPLVKQRLQNSQNVWNPDASRIFRLPKQIRSSAHVENRSPPAAPPLPDSGNTLPPPPSLLSTRSHAPHLQITITSLFILFDPSGPSAAVAKDRTSQISQTSLPCTCSPAGPPGFGTLRRQICARARSHATFCCQMFPLLLLNEQLLQAGENGRSLGLKPKAGSPGKSSHRSCLSSVRPSALSPAQHIWWDLRRRKWRA